MSGYSKFSGSTFHFQKNTPKSSSGFSLRAETFSSCSTIQQRPMVILSTLPSENAKNMDALLKFMTKEKEAELRGLLFGKRLATCSPEQRESIRSSVREIENIFKQRDKEKDKAHEFFRTKKSKANHHQKAILLQETAQRKLDQILSIIHPETLETKPILIQKNAAVVQATGFKSFTTEEVSNLRRSAGHLARLAYSEDKTIDFEISNASDSSGFLGWRRLESSPLEMPCSTVMMGPVGCELGGVGKSSWGCSRVVAFINDKDRIISFSFRGTVPTNASDLANDALIFLKVRPVVGQENAKIFIKSVQERYGKDYRIFYTGHSLGGAQATLESIDTGDLCFAFDTPGCKELLPAGTIIPEGQIQTGLSEPNLVNETNTHVGDVHRLPLSKDAKDAMTSLDSTYQKVRESVSMVSDSLAEDAGLFGVFVGTKIQNLGVSHSIDNLCKGLDESVAYRKPPMTREALDSLSRTALKQQEKYEKSEARREKVAEVLSSVGSAAIDLMGLFSPEIKIPEPVILRPGVPVPPAMSSSGSSSTTPIFRSATGAGLKRQRATETIYTGSKFSGGYGQ